MTPETLAQSHCVPRSGREHALDRADIERLLGALPGWNVADDGQHIEKQFTFDDFHRTMAFVNAVAWIAHREDHHPDFEVGYARCVLRYSTHDVGGLSLNDFICAAHVERLLT
ncbi:MAG TPA: 4a-hydroxytetrahydrobiopterin dehydratase [Dokdonella sp.]|uniref:4a-hydroxytetrahydrobiopterin dehydratase n=1 Tax=Dokdonella sp. TaxID=2291710 RepID=UPI0025B9ECA1|nr:4a-hydroxytetrahydrobiopterin dehydratase [Dokdonella sp.]MBX3692827.1 4a-hydroxytetrahydrobiopterin dehydratase [Dokdonella sp.]MCW5567778.1 4a-hydroxytetrahydrobiopterin dehydratase [Dokdonella sp.]HNR91037.1 4a-hydroxytetrahydrobiopterin dehydratase [Dokdonella sp.]